MHLYAQNNVLLIAPPTILLQTFWKFFLVTFSFTTTKHGDDVITYSKLLKHNPKIKIKTLTSILILTHEP